LPEVMNRPGTNAVIMTLSDAFYETAIDQPPEE
jgi:hypothetical protein